MIGYVLFKTDLASVFTWGQSVIAPLSAIIIIFNKNLYSHGERAGKNTLKWDIT